MSQPVEWNPTNAARALEMASGWPLVMFDEFDPSNSNQWNTRLESSRVTITKVINGKYVWNVKAHRDVTAWTHAPYRDEETTNDFIVSVDCRRVSGPKTSAMGLVFRGRGENLYYFKVGNEGRFGVFLLEGGGWTSLIPSTQSYAIQPNDVNRLTVIGEGSHFLFLINNQYVGEVEDHRLTSGSVGIAINLRHAGEGAIFEFDNFELRRPMAPPLMQSQLTATPTATYTYDLVLEY
jgi:hypothetical protein